jgi:prepilin peptidase CpaA
MVLGALLGRACWTDIRMRRIENKLVLSGALIGLALHAFLPHGSGLFKHAAGGIGLLHALAGFGLALALLLPLYALRAMGAGDVKLMAMVGAFLGPTDVLGAVAMTLLAGGILGVAVALKNGVLRRTLANVYAMMMQTMIMAMTGQGARVDAVPASAAGTLPYALAIAAGTCAHMLMERSGHALFS